jgi:hypothetical protein
MLFDCCIRFLPVGLSPHWLFFLDWQRMPDRWSLFVDRHKRMASGRIGIDEYFDAIVLLNMLMVVFNELSIELFILHEQLLHFQHLSE